jgi:hypothetical protein
MDGSANTSLTSDTSRHSLSSAGKENRSWRSPGVSPRKRVLTTLFVAAAILLFFWIARAEGATMLVSSILGVIFIGGFVWYLVAVAPKPFAITLDGEQITRQDAGAEPVVVPWTSVARVKEELFPNGKTCSVAVYKRVGETGVARAWVVYGDDVPNFAALVAALRESLPEGVPWMRVTVHE